MMIRWSFLLLAALSSCASLSPEGASTSAEGGSASAMSDTTAYPPPTVSFFRLGPPGAGGGSVQATVTFRSEGGVPLDTPPEVAFEVGGTVHPCTDAETGHFTEPSGTVVDQLACTLPAKAYRALESTPAESVHVRVSHPEGVRTYPLRRGDLLEATPSPTQPSPPLLQGLRTATYAVPDIAHAKAWYAEVLGSPPTFDEPFYVGFEVGGYELGLVPAEGESAPGEGGVTVYWGVPDAEAALARLLALGASAHEGVQDVGGGIRVATVLDPFGNVLGVIENPHFRLPTSKR